MGQALTRRLGPTLCRRISSATVRRLRTRRSHRRNSARFRNMIDEGSQPNTPFQVILVWKFSRFTRKREHAVAFKSMLTRKGVRVVSITEQADDSPTGKLMEAIIEIVDEFYSQNLAQEVTLGMREAASRGFFLGSKAPFGYRRVKSMTERRNAPPWG